MKKLSLFIVMLLASLFSFSQTKRIAHRSHSGKEHTFSIAGGDNFGLPSGGTTEKKTDKKEKPKKSPMQTLPPVKTDTLRTDTIKTMPAITREQATKTELCRVLLAAQRRCRTLGLL